MNNKFAQFLGIAVKSGNVYFGYDCVKEGIEKGNIKLVLLALDFSNKSKGKLISFLGNTNICYIEIKETVEDIMHYTGKYCGVLGIKDYGIAKRLKELNEDRSREEIRA